MRSKRLKNNTVSLLKLPSIYFKSMKVAIMITKRKVRIHSQH